MRGESWEVKGEGYSLQPRGLAATPIQLWTGEGVHQQPPSVSDSLLGTGHSYVGEGMGMERKEEGTRVAYNEAEEREGKCEGGR